MERRLSLPVCRAKGRRRLVMQEIPDTPPAPPPSRPTRLLLLSTELGVGGAERCLVRLATHLDAQRFSAQVVSLAPPPSRERAELAQQLQERGVPVRFLGLRHGGQFPSAVRQIRQIARQERIELVQSMLFHANVVAATAFRNDPHVAVVGGLRVAEPRRGRLWLVGRAARHMTRLVCVSGGVAEHYRRRAGIDPAKLVVIPNAWEPPPQSSPSDREPPPRAARSDRRLLAVVGRLDRQKGIDWLLRLLPEVFARLPNHDLLIVGEGPQRGKLERRARRLGIDRRVLFTGFQRHAAAVLPHCDMLLLPSRWEGMPNVVLEAMAAGLPVVARNVEGIAELLGPLGLEQVASDPPGFSQRVIGLARNHDHAQEVGQQNRVRVLEQFTIQRMVAAYERLYEESLAAAEPFEGQPRRSGCA